MSIHYIIGGKRKSQGKNLKLGFTYGRFFKGFPVIGFTLGSGLGSGLFLLPREMIKKPLRVNGGELC